MFIITQVHTPETCPIDKPGTADTLIESSATGIKLKGRWGAWSHHIIYYLVETDSLDAIQKFLGPGMKKCTCTVEPVGEIPLQRTSARRR